MIASMPGAGPRSPGGVRRARPVDQQVRDGVGPPPADELLANGVGGALESHLARHIEIGLAAARRGRADQVGEEGTQLIARLGDVVVASYRTA